VSFVSVVSRLQHLSPKSVALVLACGALSLGAVTLDAQAQAQTLPIAARAKGLKTAPVTVYEMADFQCPYCRQFAVETMPTIDKEYVKTGKVRWVFINLPLQSLHANAEAAAEFAACAGRENRFWQAHDMLYQAQADWENLPNPAAYFQSHFVSLGLKRDSMMQCLTSGAGAAMVKDDAAGAEKAGAHSTPTFYIEGGMMDGAQPIGIFRRVLDSIYTAKKKQH
jgi:protein-disulfide isomerase